MDGIACSVALLALLLTLVGILLGTKTEEVTAILHHASKSCNPSCLIRKDDFFLCCHYTIKITLLSQKQ